MSLENSKNTEVIVNTAVRLFKKYGYTKVSVNEICKEANIPRSSFYSVFSGKKEIIVHVLSSVKADLSAVLKSFVMAQNDFERMWSLCDEYLKIALDFGPELTGSVFAMELDESFGMFENVHSMNEWFVMLAKKCQEQGIARNRTNAEVLAPIVTDQVLQITFEWCRLKGSFSLRERSRQRIEAIYDIADEYRAKKTEETKEP